MNYIKLYESFKLNKYESDYKKYDDMEIDLIRKKKEVENIERYLKQLDITIKQDNK